MWHYDENSRQTRDGDIVLMDFGADLDYQAMDITRTWPVNGVFTTGQREVYQLVLEVQKASIEADRPGVAAADVRKYVADRMKAKGLDPGCYAEEIAEIEAPMAVRKGARPLFHLP